MSRAVSVDFDDFLDAPGLCGSCGYFAAPTGTICRACSAVPGNTQSPEHIGSILPRVMADLATCIAPEVLH